MKLYKLDLEVLYHRLVNCLWGKHQWQTRVNYFIDECYWCGKCEDKLEKVIKEGKWND